MKKRELWISYVARRSTRTVPGRQTALNAEVACRDLLTGIIIPVGESL